MKHGYAKRGLKPPEYEIWQSMIKRCHYPRSNAWKDYGARGISVCQEWRESFVAFFQHIGPRPSSDLTIDRINNDKGYEPGNVRWATRSQQAKNRRRWGTKHFEKILTVLCSSQFLGRWVLIDEIAESLGLDRGVTRVRMRQMEEALISIEFRDHVDARKKEVRLVGASEISEHLSKINPCDARYSLRTWRVDATSLGRLNRPLERINAKVRETQRPWEGREPGCDDE